MYHKKHETLATIYPIYVCINRINNGLVLKIKDGYKPELQMSETTESFGRKNEFIGKTKNGENVPSREVVQVVLVQCNLIDNQYQLNIIHFYAQ